MKKIISFLILFVFINTQAFAFLYTAKILTKDEIHELTQKGIIDVYIEAVIEKKASETFHGKSGFSPKEYGKYKELLGFIVKLHLEMKIREVDIPPIEDWLR